MTYPLSFGLPAMLKANSDVKFVMIAAVTSMVLMRVGLCYILTCDWAGTHMGAMGLWIGMVADWGLRSLLFGGRMLSGRWKKSSGLLREPPPVAAAPVVGEAAVTEPFAEELSLGGCETEETAPPFGEADNED